MPLRTVSPILESMSEHSAHCRDDGERDVIVRVSAEVVREFGWDQGFEAASDMFDAGRFNDKKDPAIVSVEAQDVKDWLAN